MHDQPAWIEFADSMSAAFARLADNLRAAAAKEDVVLSDDVPRSPIEDRTLGKRQIAIIEVLEASPDEGVKTAEIAEKIDYQVPNTYSTLQGLQGSGIVEQVPNVHPMRWRLTPRYRRTADPYMSAAAVLQPGEWTTYGDISIAVRGDNKAARAVGRAAAMLSHFPNPHRVLKEGGVVPEGWHSDDGHGPEECRRRLQAEGVVFDTQGHADPRSRVAWDVIVGRLETPRSD